jgi:dethiobiotin synthetase
MIPPGLFVTATGTGVGKTFVSRALTAALHAEGRVVAALKPIETGFSDPSASDAQALARACARPELASAHLFYRARPPLAPWAATLSGAPPPPPLPDLVRAIEAAGEGADFCLIEGAGGLLVPYDAEHTLADLALALSLPLLLVACDQLGVLSHVLTAHESAARRGLRVAAIVLVATDRPDPSSATNARILEQRTGTPVLRFPRVADDDRALARAAESSGLSRLARAL